MSYRVAELLPAVEVSAETQHRIEQFLYYEVRLLDQWRWREWFELLADDVRYWMPVRRNRMRARSFAEEDDGGVQVGHFNEDKGSIDSRIRQLESGTHWAEDPPSRTRHLITNVWVCDVREEGGVARFWVGSNFLCYRNRLEREVDLWAGQREDELRSTSDGGLQIAERVVLLDESVILSNNLSVFF